MASGLGHLELWPFCLETQTELRSVFVNRLVTRTLFHWTQIDVFNAVIVFH